jgi:hypothetical protein
MDQLQDLWVEATRLDYWNKCKQSRICRNGLVAFGLGYVWVVEYWGIVDELSGYVIGKFISFLTAGETTSAY